MNDDNRRYYAAQYDYTDEPKTAEKIEKERQQKEAFIKTRWNDRQKVGYRLFADGSMMINTNRDYDLGKNYGNDHNYIALMLDKPLRFQWYGYIPNDWRKFAPDNTVGVNIYYILTATINDTRLEVSIRQDNTYGASWQANLPDWEVILSDDSAKADGKLHELTVIDEVANNVVEMNKLYKKAEIARFVLQGLKPVPEEKPVMEEAVQNSPREEVAQRLPARVQAFEKKPKRKTIVRRIRQFFNLTNRTSRPGPASEPLPDRIHVPRKLATIGGKSKRFKNLRKGKKNKTRTNSKK